MACNLTWACNAATRQAYDVIVVGGGPAGVSAALAARRCGRRVLLAEKGCLLGGLATLGLVALYNPPLDDGRGRRLVGGLAEELLHLSVAHGFRTLPPQWRRGVERAEGPGRCQTLFSVPAFALSLVELLNREGVAILFDALFLAPVMEGRRCTGVLLAGKAGIAHYPAAAVVDCTGDADVFTAAGAEIVRDDGNWLTYWAQSTSLERMVAAAEKGDIGGGIAIEALGARANGEGQPPGARRYGLADGEELSDLVLQGQLLAYRRLLEMDPARECFTALPAMPQARKTRFIRGQYALGEADRLRHFDDSIGCVAEEWNRELLLEIPYRTLLSPQVDNILAAGRAISCTGQPQDTTRLIAVSALTGEAAGRAAAILVETGGAAAALDVARLQRELVKAGNLLHF